MIVLNKQNISIDGLTKLSEECPSLIEKPSIVSEAAPIASTDKNQDKMLSRRYELKYRINESKARAIARYVEDYIPADKYSITQPDYEYPISSLYLDSNTLDLFNETIDKKVNRFKLRIRCYDDNPESPCFFEIKRRFNTVIVKDRARAEKCSIANILQNPCFLPCNNTNSDEEILKQFQFYARMINIKPIVLVKYMRQAYEGDTSNRVRITFDRNLSFKTVNQPKLQVNGLGWQNVPMDFVVLEIKFTENYPAWLSEMVKMFDLKQTSMSKYVSTVKQSMAFGYSGMIGQEGVN